MQVYRFKEVLKKLRQEKGLTQAELGDKLGVTNSTISGWESGTRVPDIITVNKIATFFNVTIDYLVRDNEPVKPEVKDNINNNGIDISNIKFQAIEIEKYRKLEKKYVRRIILVLSVVITILSLFYRNNEILYNTSIVLIGVYAISEIVQFVSKYNCNKRIINIAANKKIMYINEINEKNLKPFNGLRVFYLAMLSFINLSLLAITSRFILSVAEPGSNWNLYIFFPVILLAINIFMIVSSFINDKVEHRFEYNDKNKYFNSFKYIVQTFFSGFNFYVAFLLNHEPSLYSEYSFHMSLLAFLHFFFSYLINLIVLEINSRYVLYEYDELTGEKRIID